MFWKDFGSYHPQLPLARTYEGTVHNLSLLEFMFTWIIVGLFYASIVLFVLDVEL